MAYDVDEYRDGIGGWDKCVADAYNQAKNSYGLVDGNCSGGTSNNPIIPQNDQNDPPQNDQNDPPQNDQNDPPQNDQNDPPQIYQNDPSQNDQNDPPQFNGPVSASVPENWPTTEKLVMVKATDSDSEDNPVTISLGGADGSRFSLVPSPGSR